MKRQNSILELSVLAIALGLLAACGQDPFPKDGKITQGQLDQPAYVMDVPSRVACRVGVFCEFAAKASVLSDMGYPIVVGANLPEGASFNSRSGRFAWTPTAAGKTTVYVLLSGSSEPEAFGMVRAVEINVTEAK